jgi:hypothetical protein
VYTEILVSAPPLCLLPICLPMLLEYVLEVFPGLRCRRLLCVPCPPIHLIYVACQLDYHVCKGCDLLVSVVLVVQQGFFHEGQGVSEDSTYGRSVVGRGLSGFKEGM